MTVVLMNIADMPDFNVDGPQNGARSVTKNQVYYGDTWIPDLHPGSSPSYAIPTVNCIAHGAMNCVTKMSHGVLWRCLTCNVGAYEPR